MKKLFAVALAVAMLFSLAAVSFAATAGSTANEFAFARITDKGFRVFWTGKHMEGMKPLHPHTNLKLCISS